MAQAPVLTDYVSLIVTLFDLFKQYRIEHCPMSIRKGFLLSLNTLLLLYRPISPVTNPSVLRQDG
jgi:hypothetical protein